MPNWIRRPLPDAVESAPKELRVFMAVIQLSQEGYSLADERQRVVLPAGHFQQIQKEIAWYAASFILRPRYGRMRQDRQKIGRMLERADRGEVVCNAWDFGWGPVDLLRGKGRTNRATLSWKTGELTC